MSEWVLAKVMNGLNQHKKAVNGSRILVLGIADKKNIDDMRESPAIENMSQVGKLGAKVEYSAPYVPVALKIRRYTFDLESASLSASRSAEYVNSVILTADHDLFDCEMILVSTKLIVDTWAIPCEYRKYC